MYTYKAKTEYVVDGDTFDFMVDCGFGIYANWRFRVRNFDTPESWRPTTSAEKEHGEAAKAFAKTLLEGKTVKLVSYKLAAHGRFECDIFLPDGRNFVDVMKENGFEKRESY